MTVPANNEVILITGTSSEHGLGYATARLLASRGHTVYATVRNIATAADVAGDTGPAVSRCAPWTCWIARR
jgi:NAD(P)-dependent dehydrogenase (short-subunit alcohol dehydrogenase family)